MRPSLSLAMTAISFACTGGVVALLGLIWFSLPFFTAAIVIAVVAACRARRERGHGLWTYDGAGKP